MVLLVKDVMESKHLPLMAADQTLKKAAEVMLANKLLGVVTTDVERRPSLVLTFRRLVKAIAEGVNIAKTTLAQYAVTDPVVIRIDDTVEEALRAMRKESVRFLPVVDYRNRIQGVVEPRHIAFKLWKEIPFGMATIEARARNPVVLPPDASIVAAAKAMEANGVTEVFIREGEDLKVLREWDFLEAVVREEDLEAAKVANYARKAALRVPITFDARAAVELMEENGVMRLIAMEPESRSVRVVTVTDLAFTALDVLEKLGPKAVALVLMNVEPGREKEIAERLIKVPNVTEVLSVPGIYDLVVRIEAETVDELAKTITEHIRTMREVRDTLTLVAAPEMIKRP
jgi:predicted transcriptional regulator